MTLTLTLTVTLTLIVKRMRSAEWLYLGSDGRGGLCGSSWVTKDEFYAGLAAAQAMPGPLFNFAAYLGEQLSFEAIITSLALVLRGPQFGTAASASMMMPCRRALDKMSL